MGHRNRLRTRHHTPGPNLRIPLSDGLRARYRQLPAALRDPRAGRKQDPTTSQKGYSMKPQTTPAPANGATLPSGLAYDDSDAWNDYPERPGTRRNPVTAQRLG